MSEQTAQQEGDKEKIFHDRTLAGDEAQSDTRFLASVTGQSLRANGTFKIFPKLSRLNAGCLGGVFGSKQFYLL